MAFENVADFGDGEDFLQLAPVIVAESREILFSTAVDVQVGGAVTTGPAAVSVPSSFWEAFAPTWRADGSRLGFVMNASSLFGLPAAPQPLEFGTPLLAEGAAVPDLVLHLAWGPSPGTADQLLHQGGDFGASRGIYLTAAGSAAVGEPLVAYGATETIFGLAWLPGGSGFVYSVTEGDYLGGEGAEDSGNLFVYGFASRQAARVTNFTGDGDARCLARRSRIVFERAPSLTDLGTTWAPRSSTPTRGS